MTKSLVLRAWSLVRSWSVVLGATAAMLFAGGVGLSEALTSCETKPILHGPVRDIVVTVGRQERATGALVGRPDLLEELHFQADGRRWMIVRSGSVETCDQDDSGRLLHSALRSAQGQEFFAHDFTYDKQGRLLKATGTSTNPQLVFVKEFKYGPDWRSERTVRQDQSILVTMFLDARGRVSKRVERDESRGVDLSTSETRYFADGDEYCSSPTGHEPFCIRTRLDEHGNRIESVTTAAGVQQPPFTERYEYDARGNWLARFGATSREPALESFERRAISYRD